MPLEKKNHNNKNINISHNKKKNSMHLTNNPQVLPIWFKGPLDQFNIWKFSSSNTLFLTEGGRPKDPTDIEKAGPLDFENLLRSKKFHHLTAKAGYPKGP